jgi:hypothetical protein
MRHLLLSLTLLAAPSSFAAAPIAYRDPVEVPLIGFKAVLDDGQVLTSWKHYKREDFVSYRVVKSDADATPVFPAAKAIYTTLGVGDTEYVDGVLSAGTWHYRLCIVTRYGDRWVSPVVTVVIRPDQVKRSVPTAGDFEP